MRLGYAASALVLASAACSHVEREGAFLWQCEGGKSFTVRFDSREAAVVSTGERNFVLPPARSASGARYSDGAVEFWEHQGEATLSGTADGSYRNCRLR